MKLKNTLLIFLVLALLAPAAFAQLNNVNPATDAALPAPVASANVFKGIHLDAAGNPITGGTNIGIGTQSPTNFYISDGALSGDTNASGYINSAQVSLAGDRAAIALFIARKSWFALPDPPSGLAEVP